MLVRSWRPPSDSASSPRRRHPPARLYEDRGKILFGIAAIFATLIVLSGLLSRGIARPIEILSDATRAVARGSGHVPPPPPTAAIEIQALYVDFAQMTDAIERRSRYLRDFAHAVSHEFKTPLAGIRGAIELLEDHHATMSDEDRRRFRANAAMDAGRLTLLITRLLDLARADMADSQANETAHLPLVLRRLADAYGGPGIAVLIDLADNLPPVAMPAATLEAAIGGLIENSRQAGATNVALVGRIEIRGITLTVSDDGPGIPTADRARIFEPFFTSKRASGGTGLGLAITRSLLASYQASIDLAATQHGAALQLQLPGCAPWER